MSAMITPEIRDLQQKYEDLRASLARTQGEVEEIKRQTTNNARQTIWQFVIFTVTMAGILIGGLNYQTNALRSEFGPRFDAVNARLDNLEKRLDRVERNLDELNKELRDTRNKRR